MRLVVCVLGVVLLSGCGQDIGLGGGSDASELDRDELAEAECEGEAEEWVVGLPADAEGAATPEGALERAQGETANPLPTGEPRKVAETSDNVEYGFADGPDYTGSATVREMGGTWFAESAVVCR